MRLEGEGEDGCLIGIVRPITKLHAGSETVEGRGWQAEGAGGYTEAGRRRGRLIADEYSLRSLHRNRPGDRGYSSLHCVGQSTGRGRYFPEGTSDYTPRARAPVHSTCD